MPKMATSKSTSPSVGFENLLDLAMPGCRRNKNKETADQIDMYRSYLRAVDHRCREAPVFVAARHALESSRTFERPSLVSSLARLFMNTTLQGTIKLCHPEIAKYTAVVTPYHDNGLFANILQVYDALLLSCPDVVVLVDWRRKGSEGHFQYGHARFDLWQHLFEPSNRCKSISQCPDSDVLEGALILPSRVNCVFMNMFRGFFWTLSKGELANLRWAYSAAADAVRPSTCIQKTVDSICGSWDESVHVVGVHKRLGTPEVSEVQLSQRIPSITEFIAHTLAVFASTPEGVRQVVFLATDDANAAAAFVSAFPVGGRIELVCREGVKRTTGGVRPDGVDNEVHRGPCTSVDAEDVMIDALCLARCHELICIDSNVSICVALWNPDLKLHPLNDILPENWELEAQQPSEVVHSAYEVIHDPVLFVRSKPTAASDLLGAKKIGEIVTTTGRAFQGWVEIEDGGWLLLDGERQLLTRGRGNLMKPHHSKH